MSGASAGVLLDRKKRRHADALFKLIANDVPRAFWSNHRHVDVVGRHNLPVVNVESVREHQHIARLEVRLDFVLVYLRCVLIGNQDHDDIGDTRSFIRRQNEHVGRLRAGARRTSLSKTYDHVGAAVFEIQRVGVPLAAVTDDRDSFPRDLRQVRVRVVVDRRHSVTPCDSSLRCEPES